VNIAIIPARGGSKRIPRKNIKEFNGKPMIAYAILAAKLSRIFDHIIVSTDDEEIAIIAQEWGAETPFLRPTDLANDYEATMPVIAHGIRFCHDLGWDFDYVCCIYPCVPFIKKEDLLGAYTRLIQNESNFCFPVTEFPSAIQRALKSKGDGTMQPFYPEFEQTRTQELEPGFYDVGQFYWGRTEAWLSNQFIHSDGLGYRIPPWRIVDIDTKDDWEYAEILSNVLEQYKNKEG
jgi:pseudaminic acid cytidylyltransferase